VALVAENKVLAHPASVDSLPTSGNREDHVSMGMTSAIKLQQVIENVNTVIAIEALCAAQGLDFLLPLKPGKGSLAAYKKIRETVPHIKQDTILAGYIAKAAEAIRKF
jgi:histidine ammonia-lyase